MDTQILIKIDNHIGRAENTSDENKYLSDFAKHIIEYYPEIEFDETNITKSILNKELPYNCQRFIAYCLLRIFNINNRIFEKEKYYKVMVFTLFDNTLKEVYSSLSINEKTETFIKESKLSDYVKMKEKEIQESVSISGDIQVLSSFENRFRKTVNLPLNKALIKNFLNIDFNQQEFDKLFKALDQYTNNQSINKYDQYQQVIKTLDNLIIEFEDIGTKYSITFFSQQFKQIKEIVLNDFINSPYSKPAKLIVLETEKKYPFSSPNSKNYIELKIINQSTGTAFKTSITIKDYNSKEIEIQDASQYVGTINKMNVNVEFEYIVKMPTANLVIEGEVIWHNFDDKQLSNQFLLELKGQDSKINWRDLEQDTPYDLEAVESEKELVGRDSILNQLKLKTKKKLGSSYIYGQRRVGKTSIVKTLQSIENNPEKILILYLEAGDWNDAQSPFNSMDNLGRKICDKIKQNNSKFKSLKTPTFHGSFTKLTDFLDDITEIDKSFKVLIILDEFDRISKDLCRRGDIGQSFVLTLRSISNRPNFGFILVGGEKLEHILSQWLEFNKFTPIRVDYFDKEKEWDDFKRLIKHPVIDKLEISDTAIDYIYNQTSGNPYFTKLICMELYSYMVKNRDNHVTEKEAIKATELARDSSNVGATDFSHFWEDGIKEKAEKEEEVSINRRKVLLSIAEILKFNENSSKELIISRAIDKGLSEGSATKILEEFEQRKILKIENGSYKFWVKFFEDWLINDGIERIITTFEEEERVVIRKKMEDEIRIKDQDIINLLQTWKTYKGVEITSEKVRLWLAQFEDLNQQKIMFHLLNNLTFYNEITIRHKMEILFNEVQKELKKSDSARILVEGKIKRADIIVSYLDGNPVKSGPEYAKLFVEVNNIYKENSTVPEKIPEKLNTLGNVRALVFVDDMSGSGRSVFENIEEKILCYKDLFIEKKIIVIIGIVTGFMESIAKIEKYIEKNNLPIIVKLIDPLNDSDKCFSETSKIFPHHIQRKIARDICCHYGLKLEPNNPLGYFDCQATIIFPHTCPNNTLPILWKETNEWKPLFKR